MMPYPYARWAPLVLRLITGIGLMAHGMAKLLRGPEAFAAVLDGMHVPLAGPMAWLTILVELGGGLATLLGAYIPLVTIPVAIVLIVAMAKVHWPYGFSSIKLVSYTALGPVFGPPGYELDLFYLACLTALTVGGPGPLALDHLFAGWRTWRESRVREHNN